MRAGAEPWPTAAQAARAGLAARARPRRREIARRASDVGQAQARRSAAPPGPGDLGGRSRTHPQEAHRQRPRRAGSFLRRKPGGRRFPFHANERYAKRLPKGLRPRQPGEIVQIDTLFVNIAADKPIKHFTAYCPVAKWTVAKAFNRATAAAACAFLDKVIADMPFPVEAIQVDGGAEFKAEFEQACQAKGIRLYELPPKRPQINGAVERCNGSWRYEFYQTYDLPRSVEALNPILNSFQHLYNHHRPHGALAGRSPAEYLKIRRANDTPPSHMY